MARQLLILAGGQGTRLRDRLGDLPKPMIPIGGKPLLEHQVELARAHGFFDLIFLLHRRAELIEAHFGDGGRWGVRIRHCREQAPLGTAGAVRAVGDALAERFAVLYGDTMVNVDLDRLWRAHERGGADATLFLHANDHPFDSDLVETDDRNRIVAFHNRPHPPGVWRQNLVNAGLYVLERRAIADWDAREGGDFGRDVFPSWLARGRPMLGYCSPEFIKDIGTPDRYDRVCAQYEAGVVRRSSLNLPQRAVFLDRDGTLNVDRDGVRTAEELTLLPGAAEAVRLFNRHGWRAVVVTNQPVVAKGWTSEAELRRIHNKLESLLGLEHAFLDRIYFCPHHPDRGFPGERPELKLACACRKPEAGMIRAAREELHVDPARSWMVGDTTVDLETARRAGVRSVLVQTGQRGRDGKFQVQPRRIAADVLEAARFIVQSESPS